jgi:tryptophanyl-tRNA synthetase
MTATRVVSGIRPTGAVHLGNYLGAIRNSVALQESYQGFYFIADLHAITEKHDPRLLSEHTLATAALYLACGIDPCRAMLFVQSHVPAHAQLARLLGSVTPVGMLKRMIQYKEKAVKQGQDASLGLLDYPVLMAADILVYDADLVPVGDDQRQHLELTREIADRFNRLYGKGDSVLKLPQPLLVSESARVMSLTDGRQKMSKSDPNDASRVNLLDSADVIRKKIKRAKTDSIQGLEFDNPERPEAHNLLALYLVLSGKCRQEVVEQCGQMGFGEFKMLLAETIVQTLEPIQARYHAIRQDNGYLVEVLGQGRARAEEIANEKLTRAHAAVGFTSRL